MRKCCLIHLTNNSTCQGTLQSANMVASVTVKLLVRNASFLPVPVSLIGCEADAPEVLAADRAGQRNGLIADDARTEICQRQINMPKLSIRFGTGDKEDLSVIRRIKPPEVQIAAIHDVDRSGLQHQNIEHLDTPHLAIGDVDEAGNFASQIE